MRRPSWGERLLSALETRHGAWDLTISIAWICLAVVVLLPPVQLNHDAALLLEIGRQITEGGRPYVDYLETNPPWVHYLAAIPAGVAAGFSWPVVETFQLLIWLVIGGSVLACRDVLRRAEVAPMLRGLLLLSLICVALINAYAGDYGQKEQVWFALVIPWVLALGLREGTDPRWPGKLWMMGLGVAAAVGAQLKPHYVAVALAVVASLAVTRRSVSLLRSPAFVGLVLGGLGYPLLLLGLPDASQHALRDVYLPVVATGYEAYSSPWRDILGISALPFVLYGGAVWAAVRGGVERGLRDPLFWFLAWSSVAYFAQVKGFQYHRIPLLGVSGLICAAAVHAWHRPDRPVGLSAWLVGVSMALFLGIRGGVASPTPTPLFDLVADHAAPGDRVLVIDTAVSPTFPGLVEAGYRPASRYLPSFPIAMAYDNALSSDSPYRSLEDAPDLERQFFVHLAEDVERHAPPVVLIQQGPDCKACPVGFELPRLLEHNGFMDEHLDSYVRVGEARGIAVWVRAP
jgi:hypothetical protein